MRLAMMRVTMSGGVPAEYGTTIRIGLFGYVSCAHDGIASTAAPAPEAETRKLRRECMMDLVLCAG